MYMYIMYINFDFVMITWFEALQIFSMPAIQQRETRSENS